LTPNFSTQSSHVSAGGVWTGRPRLRVALVVGRGQDHGGRPLAQLVGNRERVEQDEVVAELDRV